MLYCYATNPIDPSDKGFLHSRTIMEAFAEGSGGTIAPPYRLMDGEAAAYGILRGTEDIIRQCEYVGRDYYYVDHGYLGAGHYSGYYRVTKNGRQAAIPPESEYVYPPDRLNATGIKLRPWKRRGTHILVIPLTGAVAAFYGIDPGLWLESIQAEIASHTSRPVIIKEKGLGSINQYLKEAWCLVTHSSNSAVDALVDGVPVVVTGESACAPMSWKFKDIESPVWPERDWWLRALAYQQFTLDEMKSGVCWEAVR
jgi:hypothetical protein